MTQKYSASGPVPQGAIRESRANGEQREEEMSEIMVAVPDGFERNSGAAGTDCRRQADRGADRRLRRMVLDAVISSHARRNYAKSLDESKLEISVRTL